MVVYCTGILLNIDTELFQFIVHVRTVSFSTVIIFLLLLVLTAYLLAPLFFFLYNFNS